MSMRCATCDAPLNRPEVAAAAYFLDTETVWCLDCWDAEDEVALSQYVMSGLRFEVTPCADADG